MSNARCRVCDHIQKAVSFVAKDYFLGTKKEYPYHLCHVCGSLSIIKIPEELDELYANYYSFSDLPEISFVRSEIYKYVLKNIGWFSKALSFCLTHQNDLPIKSLQPIRIKRNMRILDVGCGAGFLLRFLHKTGFKNCLGIDPYLEKDINCLDGLSLKKKETFDLNEKFDIIMFHHVFEHFSNPEEVLSHVSTLLAKGGTCLIRVPNIDSYSFLRYKENWFSIHAPFHLFLPSRVGMEQIAKNAGLVVDKVIGEQLIDFFLYSMGHELGVADYEERGNRKFIETYGTHSPPPLHIKNELKDARQRKRQVKKYDLCDWVVYYLRNIDCDDRAV